MKILLRLLRYAYRYRFFTILAYLCLLGTIALGLVQPLIIQQVIDRGIGQRDSQFLLFAAGLLVVVNVGSSLLGFGMSYLNELVSQRVAYDLRNALYDHLQRLSFAYHNRAKTGELMSRVTSDVDSARIFTGQGVLQIVNTVVLYVTILVLMFTLHWQLALLSLLTMPFLAFTAVTYGTRVRPLFSRMQRQWAQLTAVLQENITGVRVVKAFAREPFEVEKFERENQVYLERNIAATRLQALVYPLMLFISSLGSIAIIWFGGQEVIRGSLTIGTLLAFNSYLQRLAQPTRMLGFIIAWISRATASGERLFEILDAPSPVQSPRGAPPLPPVEGRVVFDQVSFSYNASSAAGGGAGQPVMQPLAERLTDSGFATPQQAPREQGKDGRDRTLVDPTVPVMGGRVLHDVSLVAEPDQVVALIGHTGAGKTSVVALIPRFYDVEEGAVRIDGHDVREVDLQSLRRQVGMVMQESLLFSATVAENIAYGAPGATMDRIEGAARAAQAEEFIKELPEGYETKVGERGVTLSGGQRQRLAIARALLIDPRILILDDATASVDMRTEFQIQQALQALMKGRTTFVIAQRLSTIKQADQILVLDHGRIVQRGQHDSLVAIAGPYRDIYDLQLRDQEEVLRDMSSAGGANGGGEPALESARTPVAGVRSAKGRASAGESPR
ncbi:MAG: ABC transporter ATP-binding protein/permease [Chloroflexota bacterium]|nr:ABC transporter ATP-binding protein/permease [Chloroflexota bacterium]